jgi:hypothetical protein
MSAVQDICSSKTVTTTQVTSRNMDDVVLQPVARETVPGGASRHLLAPQVRPESDELAQLREIARARRGVVSAVPTVSQAGQHGLTPHQQFLVMGSMLFASTFTIAFIVANFLP